MYGNTVQLLRYKITWETSETIWDGAEVQEKTITQEEYCISDDHRDEIIQKLVNTLHTVETIDQTSNEWIDGLEFPDVSKVPEALDMGEEVWKRHVNDNNMNLQVFKYLTDLDFRLLLLEWGIL
jgi:hypothetical protein